ncbi:ATP-binding protein [Roseobacter weihaiensis]|uniref:ATP-binding protein n=1 Tax=Roseobacter weihaiensis TaxID=2763262 RepID=UPI001D0A356B|nr:ATP-binding protein [Roseobacter sp. H9]
MTRQPLPPFEVCVQSGQLAVRQALRKVFEALRPLDLDVEEAGTIEIVLAEVLNNIVEHAYPPTGPAGPIAIHFIQQPDGLRVKVMDQGNKLPDEKVPLVTAAPLDVELQDMPEGGFGWLLIQHLAKDVTYARVGKENHLNMRLAVGLPS